ncbi:MMPL family transporter [Actinoplanes sp. CA-054009]
MARFRWPVLAVALVAVISAGVWGLGVFGQVSEGGYNDPNSESSRAAEAVTEAFGARGGDLVVIYTPTKGKIDDAALGKRVRERLAALPKSAVTGTTSYWQTRSAQYAAKDKKSAVALVTLAGADDTAKLDAYREIDDKFAVEGATVQLAGATVLADASTTLSTSDLGKAEAISLPITLILLLFIFGSLVAAALPVLVGGAAVLGSLGILHAIASHHEVNSFAVNVASLLGLGMAIDYGLFMVGRFREEQAAGRTPAEAVQRTVATAGRTVLFSASLLMIALAGLLLFPQGFLNSLAYGGLAAVGLAALLSLTLLPAVLAVLGPRVDKLPVRLPFSAGDPDKSFWARLATGVLRRPVVVAVPILAGLLLLALPIGGVRFGEADERTLPAGDPARQAIETLQASYPQFAGDGVQIVLRGKGDTAKFAVQLRQIPGITQITPAQRAKDTTVFTATLSSTDPFSTESRDVVDGIRALPVPARVELLVGGTTARNIDSLQATADKLPLMIGLLVGATLILMFLAFGSILLPIKAVLMSALSLSATFGILVWIFQDGNLAGLLNVTPAPLEAGIVVLMAAVVFGLSTDYEVFLLSRMVEARANGATSKEAVTTGLARTGRVISAAALLLIVVTGAFALSSVTTMRFVGVGMIVALVLDATVVRMLLVPAVLGLLGDAAWWAPGPLKRLQQKAGLSEHAGELPTGRHAATDDTQVLALPAGPSPTWLAPFFEEPRALPGASSPYALPPAPDPAATQVFSRITDDEPIDAEIIPDPPADEPASSPSSPSSPAAATSTAAASSAPVAPSSGAVESGESESDATAVVADLGADDRTAAYPVINAGAKSATDDRTAAYPVIGAGSVASTEPATSESSPAASPSAASSSAGSSSVASSPAASSAPTAEAAPAPTGSPESEKSPLSEKSPSSEDPSSSQEPSSPHEPSALAAESAPADPADEFSAPIDTPLEQPSAETALKQPLTETALEQPSADSVESRLVEAAAAEAVRAGIERAEAEMAADEADAAYAHAPDPVSVESTTDTTSEPDDDIIDAEIIEDDDLPRGSVYPSSTAFLLPSEPSNGSTYSSSNYTDYSAPDEFFFSSSTSTFTSAFALPAEPDPVDTSAPTPFFGDRPEAPTFFREPLALPPIPPTADPSGTDFERTRALSPTDLNAARTTPPAEAPAEPGLDVTTRFEAPDLEATTRFTAPDLASTRRIPASQIKRALDPEPTPTTEEPPAPTESALLSKRPSAPAEPAPLTEPTPLPRRQPLPDPAPTAEASATTPAPSAAEASPTIPAPPSSTAETRPAAAEALAGAPVPAPLAAETPATTQVPLAGEAPSAPPAPTPVADETPAPLAAESAPSAPVEATPLPRRRTLADVDPFRAHPEPLPQRAFQADPLPRRQPAEGDPFRANLDRPLPQRPAQPELPAASAAPAEPKQSAFPALPALPIGRGDRPTDLGSYLPQRRTDIPAQRRPEETAQPALPAQPSLPAQPMPTAQPTAAARPMPAAQPVPDAQPTAAARPMPAAQPMPDAQPTAAARPMPAAQPMPDAQPTAAGQSAVVRRPASLADQPLPHRSGRNEASFSEPAAPAGGAVPELPSFPAPRALPPGPVRRPADLGDHLRETRPADLAQYSRTRPKPAAPDDAPNAGRRPESLAEVKPARRPASLADQVPARPRPDEPDASN